jgi:hypothetical protein
MKSFALLRLFPVFSLACLPLGAATATVNLSIGEIRDADGDLVMDGEGVWAIIVAAGNTGNPPTAGSLPGGLTVGSSLAGSNKEQITIDFEDMVLSPGSKGSFYVWQIGDFTGGDVLGLNGVVAEAITFDVFAAPDPGFTAGTAWGFYWFPGKTSGQTLSGQYQVGGFANDVSLASGGDIGTFVPASGSTVTGNFFETNFNQTELGEGDTGLSAARFTAVLVPEPSSALLFVLGLVPLWRRRR